MEMPTIPIVSRPLPSALSDRHDVAYQNKHRESDDCDRRDILKFNMLLGNLGIKEGIDGVVLLGLLELCTFLVSMR